MDVLFQTQSNELSTTTQKEKLFKDAERQWNTLSTEKGAPGRKVDFEIYKSILYNLEIRKVYLDSKLSLEKFSSIVGTNTTYLSNAVNNYFGCNFKQRCGDGSGRGLDFHNEFLQQTMVRRRRAFGWSKV